VIQTNAGAAKFTLDSCELTATGTALVLRASDATFLNTVFSGTIQVPTGATVMIADSSLSFASGVRAGISVQQGGAATMTGSTLRAADTATIVVSVDERGSFAVTDSQLTGADSGPTHSVSCQALAQIVGQLLYSCSSSCVLSRVRFIHARCM
jgi:hypothetical protein